MAADHAVVSANAALQLARWPLGQVHAQRDHQLYHLFLRDPGRRLPEAHGSDSRLAGPQSRPAVGIWRLWKLESFAGRPPEQFGFKHGEAILAADTWRGPYRLVASDSDIRWGGSTANAEDPFLWIDKRGNWHQLVEGNPMPGGHAFSTDGITWSDMAGCNGAYALEGCFNLTRQYVASNGSLANVSYYTERPKLLLTADGTPTHLFGTVYYHEPDKRTGGFTIVEPLRGSSTTAGAATPFISERLQESSHARTHTLA